MSVRNQGRILGGFGGLGPPGHQSGAKKEGKGEEKERKRDEKRGKEREIKDKST